MANPFVLTHDVRAFIANALRVAAEQYDVDANKARTWAARVSTDYVQYMRLAEQFTSQALRARTYAAQLEEAGVIRG